ncbi:hypothetical protein AcW1_005941 [Taiwanofungus camphoratus]|nr:hypothetical protein AcV5_006257 [Antrodia cinnamomea]KAI0950304.1 hypothetical protein AcV7_008815 [Antrodia cinnamomea]KAI0957604.1 hypothetical protein AcW1_005941 [Antrodia cinnamomea]
MVTLARESSELPNVPSLGTGYCILISAIVFFLLGTYATLFSAFHAETGVFILDTLARDTHYKPRSLHHDTLGQ